jgi:hypothetical protein
MAGERVRLELEAEAGRDIEGADEIDLASTSG